jgi:hypothetical protein
MGLLQAIHPLERWAQSDHSILVFIASRTLNNHTKDDNDIKDSKYLQSCFHCLHPEKNFKYHLPSGSFLVVNGNSPPELR